MSDTITALVDMGFERTKVELALKKTGSTDVSVVMDWILSNPDAVVESPPELEPLTPDDTEVAQPTPSAEGEAKSIKCDDCGKLFNSQPEVEFHASKSGHENFSESTEEKKPLTDEEKKEQLAKIEAKLRQRRLDREAREKQEAVDKERNRIRSGKEMLEAKKKHDEIEMRKIVEQRKREKEEERVAKQRVIDQIAQDKLARKAKFSGGDLKEAPIVAPIQNAAPRPPTSYTEVQLQIRLTNGTALTHTFGAKEPLSAVRLYVEMNRKDAEGPFNLMIAHPRKVFGVEDYDVPLETLGLAPRAILIVSKS